MNNSFTRPPRVVGGNKQPIRASDFNLLSRAIEELQNAIPGKSKGGAVTGSAKPPFWTAISKVPGSDPATYQVTVTLGYLSYQSNTPAAQASDLGTTGWLVPTINGVSMESEDVEPLALPANESWVYLRVKTDVDGFPKEGEVTVEAFDEAQESIHHHRLNPLSAEQEGDYFFLVLKTIADESDPPKPIAERRITGNREMPNQLVEILNVGEKREWYKGYLIEDDHHEWRTAEQLETEGVALIEPLNPGKDEVPPVVSEDGTIISEGEPAVPPEEEGDTIKWRTVDGRGSGSETQNGSTRQINVRTRESDTEDADGIKRSIIEVVGNDYIASHSDVRKFSISIDDGLVTDFLKIDADAEGWWGTIQWIFYPSGGGGTVSVDLDFEAGILKRVRQDVGSVNGNVDVPGTEAAPASIAHVTSDS